MTCHRRQLPGFDPLDRCEGQEQMLCQYVHMVLEWLGRVNCWVGWSRAVRGKPYRFSLQLRPSEVDQ